MKCDCGCDTFECRILVEVTKVVTVTVDDDGCRNVEETADDPSEFVCVGEEQIQDERLVCVSCSKALKES